MERYAAGGGKHEERVIKETHNLEQRYTINNNQRIE